MNYLRHHAESFYTACYYGDLENAKFSRAPGHSIECRALRSSCASGNVELVKWIAKESDIKLNRALVLYAKGFGFEPRLALFCKSCLTKINNTSLRKIN